MSDPLESFSVSGATPALRRTPATGAEDEDADLNVDFQHILHSRGRGEGPAPVVRETPSPKPLHGNRVPMERKVGGGTLPFTRIIIRPETTVAAAAVAERAPVERVIPSGAGPEGGPIYGKIKTGDDVEYTPNRFQKIIVNLWEHSRIPWLERTGRTGLFVFVTLTTLLIAGLLWRFAVEVIRQQEGARRVVVAAEEVLPPDEVRQKAVRLAFDAFLAAPDSAGKLPWVLEPQRVEARMVEFYADRLQRDPAISSYEVSAPLRAGNEWWFTLTYQSKDGSSGSVLMKETATGGQLDWENFVAFGSMPWATFTAKRPAVPQSMRIRLRVSAFYAGKYRQEDYLAYDLSHRDSPEILHGYAPRASRTGQLLTALEPGTAWQACNLYLKWEKDAGAPGCVIIADVIRNNWLDAINSARTEPVTAPVEAASPPPVPAARPLPPGP